MSKRYVMIPESLYKELCDLHNDRDADNETVEEYEAFEDAVLKISEEIAYGDAGDDLHGKLVPEKINVAVVVSGGGVSESLTDSDVPVEVHVVDRDVAVVHEENELNLDHEGKEASIESKIASLNPDAMKIIMDGGIAPEGEE